MNKVYILYTNTFNGCDEWQCVEAIVSSKEKAIEWEMSTCPTEWKWRSFEEMVISEEIPDV